MAEWRRPATSAAQQPRHQMRHKERWKRVLLDYPDDEEIVDNLGVTPAISWELGHWERSIELPKATEALRFTYDQTGFVSIEWRNGERLLLSMSRDRADRITVWSRGGEAYLAVDFTGVQGTAGRLTVQGFPTIAVTDSQTL